MTVAKEIQVHLTVQGIWLVKPCLETLQKFKYRSFAKFGVLSVTLGMSDNLHIVSGNKYS